MREEPSGQQLRALRLACGLDAAVLARRVSLSTAQLLQLENDQHGLFYTPAIRRHAARKVLAHLSTLPVLEPQVFEVDEVGKVAPEARPCLDTAEPALTPLPGIGLAELPIQDLTELAQPEPALSPAGLPAQAEIGARLQPVIKLKPGSGRGSRNAGLWWVALLLAAASVSAWLVLIRPFSAAAPPSADQHRSMAEAGRPEVPASLHHEADTRSAPGDLQRADASKASLERDLVAMAPASALPAPAVWPSHPGLTQDGSTCPGSAEAAPRVTLKPASSQSAAAIYLLSSVGQMVCVLDGSGKVKSHRLEPGQTKAVMGSPPWTVQASALQKMQLYHQGVRIPMPADVTDRVQLIESR